MDLSGVYFLIFFNQIALLFFSKNQKISPRKSLIKFIPIKF